MDDERKSPKAPRHREVKNCVRLSLNQRDHGNRSRRFRVSVVSNIHALGGDLLSYKIKADCDNDKSNAETLRRQREPIASISSRHGEQYPLPSSLLKNSDQNAICATIKSRAAVS